MSIRLEFLPGAIGNISRHLKMPVSDQPDSYSNKFTEDRQVCIYEVDEDPVHEASGEVVIDYNFAVMVRMDRNAGGRKPWRELISQVDTLLHDFFDARRKETRKDNNAYHDLQRQQTEYMVDEDATYNEAEIRYILRWRDNRGESHVA